MDQAKFSAILPIIIQDLVSIIKEKGNLNFEKALFRLYESALFEKLSDENTKYWHFSSQKLYEILKFEEKTGKIMEIDYV